MFVSWKSFINDYGPIPDKAQLPAEAAYTEGPTLLAVCALARASKATHLLEIGTAFGHTAVALAMVCPDAKVTTLGTCRELIGNTRSRFDNEILPRKDQGNFIRQQPPEIRKRINALVGFPTGKRSLLRTVNVDAFQFAYIDGDHSWRSVVEDTRAALTRIDPNGIIVWDDYLVRCPEVKGFIDIVNLTKGSPISIVSGTKTAYVKLTAELRLGLLKVIEDL